VAGGVDGPVRSGAGVRVHLRSCLERRCGPGKYALRRGANHHPPRAPMAGRPTGDGSGAGGFSGDERGEHPAAGGDAVKGWQNFKNGLI